MSRAMLHILLVVLLCLCFEPLSGKDGLKECYKERCCPKPSKLPKIGGQGKCKKKPEKKGKKPAAPKDCYDNQHEERCCKSQMKKSLGIRRKIKFKAKKKGEMSLWPFEWSYLKAKLNHKLKFCGKFKMMVVDYPLRRMELSADDDWEMAGIANKYRSMRKKEKDGKKTKKWNKYEDEDDASDIPIHLLDVKPGWHSKFFFYKMQIYRKVKKQCKSKFVRKGKFKKSDKKSMRYQRCKIEFRERYFIGKKAMKKMPKWKLKWSKKKSFMPAIFHRKSRTYRLRIKKKYIQNMRPGNDGAGAIETTSKVYRAYQASQWLHKFIAANTGAMADKIEAGLDKMDNMMDGSSAEDDEEAEYERMKIQEVKDNIKLSFVPILYYSEFTDEKCWEDCQEHIMETHRGRPPVEHTFMKAAKMEHAERLGMAKMSFTTKWVHGPPAGSPSDGKAPNVLKPKKAAEVKISLKRICGAGGWCQKMSRPVFGCDGGDLFKGEQVLFELSILTNRKHFKLKPSQNPFVTRIVGPGVLVFGVCTRKRTMKIQPRKGKLTDSVKYKFQYDLRVEGQWHKWYLNYPKLLNTELEQWTATRGEGPAPREPGCQRKNPFAPMRAAPGCEWGPLVNRYQQYWAKAPRKPGYFKHSMKTRRKFNNMKVGSTKCGSVSAKLEEWPLNGNKYYIKLLLIIEGTQGGVVFSDDKNVLRYPEKVLFGKPSSYNKRKKQFCLQAKVPGQYLVQFTPFGSLLHLFPNEPPQLQINVAVARTFKVSYSAELQGATLYNNQWSDEYVLKINAMPDPKKFETDIVVTPMFDGIQFSPGQFKWSKNTPRLEQLLKKSFRLRPLLDCAMGGVVVNVIWEVTGMVAQVKPNPIPPFKLRIKEEVASAGCADAGEAEELTDVEAEAAFEELEEVVAVEKKVVEDPMYNVTNTTVDCAFADDDDLECDPIVLPSAFTFHVALLALTVFGVVILLLCAFGCLGTDSQFEAEIATQLQKAIIAKQKAIAMAKMSGTGLGDIIEDHYATNVEARHRLMDQTHLHPT